MALTKTLRLKDKEGVKMLNLKEGEKYVMLLSKANAEVFFKRPQDAVALMKGLNLLYVFVAEDVNSIKIEEKEQFARYLVEGAASVKTQKEL
jgi:hypothetical protein